MSMKSSDSSSTSDKPNGAEPKTYDLLLGSQEELARLRELVGSRLWDSWRDLMQAERQQHLRALEDTDDDLTSRDHKTISRWIRQWLEVIPEEIEAAHQRQENPEVERLDGGTEWMEGDGESASGA